MAKNVQKTGKIPSLNFIVEIMYLLSYVHPICCNKSYITNYNVTLFVTLYY